MTEALHSQAAEPEARHGRLMEEAKSSELQMLPWQARFPEAARVHARFGIYFSGRGERLRLQHEVSVSPSAELPAA